MPIYEYKCADCGAQEEKIQKFSDPMLTRCKKCGGKLERLLSAPAIQFKGAGWYVTDYARKSPSKESAPSESTKEKKEGKTPAPAPAPAPAATDKPASK